MHLIYSWVFVKFNKTQRIWVNRERACVFNKESNKRTVQKIRFSTMNNRLVAKEHTKWINISIYKVALCYSFKTVSQTVVSQWVRGKA